MYFLSPNYVYINTRYSHFLSIMIKVSSLSKEKEETNGKS